MNKSKVKISKPSTPQSAAGNCSGAVTNRNTPPSRNKSDKDIPYDGVYQNLRFCETITSLMGNTVQVRKISKDCFSDYVTQHAVFSYFRFNYQMGRYLKEFLALFLLS